MGEGTASSLLLFRQFVPLVFSMKQGTAKCLRCCPAAALVLLLLTAWWDTRERGTKDYWKAKTLLSSSLWIRAWPALPVSCTVLFHLILSEGRPHGLLSSHYVFLINGETGV